MTKTLDELTAWVKKLPVDEVFGMSQDKEISGVQRSIAYSVAKKLQHGDTPSYKQLKALHEIHRQIHDRGSHRTQKTLGELSAYAGREPLSADIKHLCLRMAWHDTRWNGHICAKPEANDYCVGEFSLLSERIRRRRDLNIESQPTCAGCKADIRDLGEYQPPCFWSINAFGNESLTFQHDNPVASDFPKIQQELPPYSLISWPFKLSFVRNSNERTKYGGSYYPKNIFENRIRIFQRDIKPAETIVFTYCNYSNPISGEDMKYLVTGCAMLKEQGQPQFFKISAQQLERKARELREPNFPSMNWALRYTLDFESTGVRIPYHELLEKLQPESAEADEVIREIAVTIDEPELREGFTYVAKHIDDDQAIYLLTKIRRSLLKVLEHGFVDTVETSRQLAKVEELIRFAWTKRGYLPGLKNLLCALPGLKDNYLDRIGELVETTDLADSPDVRSLAAVLDGTESALADRFEDLAAEITDFLSEQSISGWQFLRLASLCLTTQQYRRIINREGVHKPLSAVCDNPYLLFEEYEPSELMEEELTGERLDGAIDLFKVDIALMPLAKYQRRIRELHDWRATDPRRLRAVVRQVLFNRENAGDCFLESSEIAQEADRYPLFYKAGDPYSVEEHLRTPGTSAEAHLSEKLVIRHIDGRRYYYLKEIFDAEVFVKDGIYKLLQRPDHTVKPADLPDDIDQSIIVLKSRLGSRFDEQLFRAERAGLYTRVARKSFFVITGSPGAGKSYELLKTIEFLRRQGETHVVLSLTGKAVIRLKSNEEGIRGINAKTVDKFLVEQEAASAQAATSIIHNLIVDEASMVDLPKLAAVLKSINFKHLRRLILVGDPNQLPPIGFGKPLADVIDFLVTKPDMYGEHLATLQVNCRAETSDTFIGFTQVFSNESKFAEGQLAATRKEGRACDDALELAFWNTREELHEKITHAVSSMLEAEGYTSRDLPKLLGIDGSGRKPVGLDRFQVLSPYRSGYFGASGLNLHFQDALRAGVPFERKVGDRLFKLFDKVMHTQNEYEHNELLVSNGSLGVILNHGKVFFIDNTDPIRIESLRTKDMLELAYAITVHKSQGSGFGHVFIVLPEKARFSSRELLYTALTRARWRVTLFIQQGSDVPTAPELLNQIRARSAVVGRRTSLFSEGGPEYAYVPEAGVTVKSRVEYIIYRKLLEAREECGNFSFKYEDTYRVESESFDLHPDFVLRFSDGRVIYWEHLGKVTSRSYMDGWDKRRKIYELQKDLEKVVTTDELHGIRDDKIDLIIRQVVTGNSKTEDSSNRYSKMHFSLGAT